MSTGLGDRDTVAVDEEVHAIYKQLTEGNDPVGTPFRTMKDVFMWAVSLGYQKGERKPLSGKRVTVFRWAQFSPQIDLPLLKALAVADGEGIDALESQDRILQTAEEYANAGIHILRALMLAEYGQPLWNLVAAVK